MDQEALEDSPRCRGKIRREAARTKGWSREGRDGRIVLCGQVSQCWCLAGWVLWGRREEPCGARHGGPKTFQGPLIMWVKDGYSHFEI